jgi:hypothetical protein
MKGRILGLLAVALLAGPMTAHRVQAHAISIGYENAGPGAVTIWLGTYSTGHASLINEGGMRLEGVLGTVFGPDEQNFSLLAGVGVGFKPAGLIDGTTNFFAPNKTDALVDSDVPYMTTGCPACGVIERWQGVTFTGLTAGNYLFTWLPIQFPTLQWDIWNPNMNGIFSLSREIVGDLPPPSQSVPEPGLLGLLGIGFAGMLFTRRKRNLISTS